MNIRIIFIFKYGIVLSLLNKIRILNCYTSIIMISYCIDITTKVEICLSWTEAV